MRVAHRPNSGIVTSCSSAPIVVAIEQILVVEAELRDAVVDRVGVHQRVRADAEQGGAGRDQQADRRCRNIASERHPVAAPLGDHSRNTGVSSIDQRRYSDTSSSGIASEERDAPAPGGELLGGQHQGHHDEQRRRQDRPDRRAELRDRGVEGALLGTGVLGREQDRSAPLAAEREALDDAQQRPAARRRASRPARRWAAGRSVRWRRP